MKQVLKIIAGLGFIGLMVIFVMKNQWMLNQNFVFHCCGKDTPPVNFLVLILGATIAGAFVSSLIMLINQMSLKRVIRKKEKIISKMEKELNSLRNLPIIEDDKIVDDTSSY